MTKTTIHDLSGPELVQAFNYLATRYNGTSDDKAPLPVKRFNTLESGVERVTRLAERVKVCEADLMASLGFQPEPAVAASTEAFAKALSNGGGPRKGKVEPEKGRKAVKAAKEAAQAAPKRTKVDLIVDLMKRPGGATIADMTDATGWLPHTTRAAISVGVKRKLGLTVETERVGETGAKRTVYRIAA